MQNLHGHYSVHAARPQRAHVTLEDPTALPQQQDVQTPSRGVCFEHAQNKRHRVAFYAIAQRFHSVAGVCTARTAAICIF